MERDIAYWELSPIAGRAVFAKDGVVVSVVEDSLQNIRDAISKSEAREIEDRIFISNFPNGISVAFEIYQDENEKREGV